MREAARVLGVSEDAIRKRVKRDSIRYDREPDGRVYVYLDASETVRDASPDASPDASAERDLLYQEMRERIAYLERQVEEEREARRRADTLLAQLMQRVPELEAPSESRESPVSPGPRDTPTDAGEEAQDGGATPSPPLRGWYVAVLAVVLAMASFAVALYLAVTLLS